MTQPKPKQKKPLFKLLTTVRGAAPDKLRELERLRELAFWRCWGFYSCRENGVTMALFAGSTAEKFDELAKSHAVGLDLPDDLKSASREKVVAAWRAHTAALHKEADWALANKASYDDQETAAFESQRREAWYVFMDADRAVVKAGGKSAFDSDYFPGVPDVLNVSLDQLGECSGVR